MLVNRRLFCSLSSRDCFLSAPPRHHDVCASLFSRFARRNCPFLFPSRAYLTTRLAGATGCRGNRRANVGTNHSRLTYKSSSRYRPNWEARKTVTRDTHLYLHVRKGIVNLHSIWKGIVNWQETTASFVCQLRKRSPRFSLTAYAVFA